MKPLHCYVRSLGPKGGARPCAAASEVYALNDPEKVKQQKARLEEERKVREKMQATIDIQAKELSAAQIAVPARSIGRSHAPYSSLPCGR